MGGTYPDLVKRFAYTNDISRYGWLHEISLKEYTEASTILVEEGLREVNLEAKRVSAPMRTSTCQKV